ncbi:MAG: hypothetical protein M3O61_14020, partial [Gemmatimonadota bacterium]|nr:hypothetical protein [Gemmatimonadota bacterium]
LEVYWQAPNLSKQWIVGRRDTLLLPTDISYHRDHLGIVQNNFPSIIRLGEGDEVRDVPHPLSAAGLTEYDFAVRDSLRIQLGPRALDVYEVRVRPKNERAPRAVGAVYIDRESGEVVRMALSFTRAALIDKDLEDVSVVLENGLIDGFWLPRRQEIEIRRTGTWLEYPARGIIRGRWEICCYQVNVPLPQGLFAGPEIQLAPTGRARQTPFIGQILDSLPPDVRAVTDADVAKVQEEARALVRAQALARSRNLSLSARSASDVLRVNRVEGLAIGAGLTRRLGSGVSVTGRARYGLDDRGLKGLGEIGFRRASGAGASISAYREHRDASDQMETSLVKNSIAAQEFGSDYTDPFGVRGFALQAQTGAINGWNVTLRGAVERTAPLSIHAKPASGRYEPTFLAWDLRERRLDLSFQRPTWLTVGGIEAQLGLKADAAGYKASDSADYRNMFRLSARASFERPFGSNRFVAHTLIAAAFGEDALPPQHLVFLGGPTTGPGYDFHQFVGRRGAFQRVEIRFPAPFPSFKLGRYGRTPASITLAPFVSTVWIDGRTLVREVPELSVVDPHASSPPIALLSLRNGWFPSIGIGALTVFDVLRIDVARGLRDGRWTFSVDAGREFWSIL